MCNLTFLTRRQTLTNGATATEKELSERYWKNVNGEQHYHSADVKNGFSEPRMRCLI